MGTKTSIEWTRGEDGSAGATWTPIRARNIKTGKIGWHCEHATTGCEFCYAEGMNKRLGTGLPFKPGHRKDIEIFLDEEVLKAPLHWKRPRKVFVCSMSDLFAEFVQDEWIDRMFAVMALCPQHTFQILTKRAERMRAYMRHVEREAHWMNAVAELLESVPALRNVCHPILGRREPWLPLPNAWLGISAERQQEWDERKEHLHATPAAVRFASFEPLLGNIVELCPMSDFVGWAIVGGESGPDARPMHPQWARYLRDQCAAAGVPFFYKQAGEWSSIAVEGLGGNERKQRHTMRDPHLVEMVRVGKKTAGRLLDGREHNEMPKVQV